MSLPHLPWKSTTSPSCCLATSTDGDRSFFFVNMLSRSHVPETKIWSMTHPSQVLLSDSGKAICEHLGHSHPQALSAYVGQLPLVQKTRQFGGCQRNMNWILLWQESILLISANGGAKILKKVFAKTWVAAIDVVWRVWCMCANANALSRQCNARGALASHMQPRGRRRRHVVGTDIDRGPQKTSYNNKSFPDCITCMHLYAVYRCNVYSYIITTNWYQLYKYNQSV